MGNNVFHFLTENLPRLGLYHSELLADPTIKVHVVTNDEGTDNSKLHLVPKYIKSFMHFLGIPDERLTFGAIQAKVGVCTHALKSASSNSKLAHTLVRDP